MALWSDSIPLMNKSKCVPTRKRPYSQPLSAISIASARPARNGYCKQARMSGPPWSLWAVIWLTSALLLVCAIILDVEKPSTHYTMVAILGVLVSVNLFLVLELSHPFIGDIGTSSEPLQQVIRQLS